MAIRQLLSEVKNWIPYNSYPPGEIALRFGYRLGRIHPFADGNGRHSRLIAGLLITSFSGERFYWGRADLQTVGTIRLRRIEALHDADKHDIAPLLAFARS